MNVYKICMDAPRYLATLLLVYSCTTYHNAYTCIHARVCHACVKKMDSLNISLAGLHNAVCLDSLVYILCVRTSVHLKESKRENLRRNKDP